MTRDTEAMIFAALELAIWAMVGYILFTPKDPITRARAYWYAARACQMCALGFGTLAIEAELRYFQEVNA